jgi:hypothetical protein
MADAGDGDGDGLVMMADGDNNGGWCSSVTTQAQGPNHASTTG